MIGNNNARDYTDRERGAGSRAWVNRELNMIVRMQPATPARRQIVPYAPLGVTSARVCTAQGLVSTASACASRKPARIAGVKPPISGAL